MKVTIASKNAAAAVGYMLIAGDVTSAPTQAADAISIAGKRSVTETWDATAPSEIPLNLLWIKEFTAGNWQLGDAPIAFKFDAISDTAGVRNSALLAIALFPNPTSNKWNISAQRTIKNAAIYNLLGRQVMALEMNKNSESISISNAASGIYVIKDTVRNAIGTAKFIKEEGFFLKKNYNVKINF